MTDSAELFMAYWRLLAPDTAPEPVREYRFHPVRKWRFDVAWPDRLLAAEIDGGQYISMGGRHNRDSDREKLNSATVRGWRVLRYSPQMLARDPAGCVGEVLEALGNG